MLIVNANQFSAEFLKFLNVNNVNFSNFPVSCWASSCTLQWLVARTHCADPPGGEPELEPLPLGPLGPHLTKQNGETNCKGNKGTNKGNTQSFRKLQETSADCVSLSTRGLRFKILWSHLGSSLQRLVWVVLFFIPISLGERWTWVASICSGVLILDLILIDCMGLWRTRVASPFSSFMSQAGDFKHVNG